MAASEPGVSSTPREENNWRQNLILQLQERNRKQTYCFADLISLRKISFFIFINLIHIINLCNLILTYIFIQLCYCILCLFIYRQQTV